MLKFSSVSCTSQRESPLEDAELTVEDPTSQQQPPRFAVKARAYKVFSTLFYTPTPHTQPCDVNWTDFRHAMNIIGFVSVKLHGSAWSFTPKGQGHDESFQHASINFHEPHPSSKLGFMVARRYGRRLTRNYGLSGESFVLEA